MERWVENTEMWRGESAMKVKERRHKTPMTTTVSSAQCKHWGLLRLVSYAVHLFDLFYLLDKSADFKL